MSILGTPLNKAVLETMMQRFSTKIHVLTEDIQSFSDQMSQILDADIEQMYVDAGFTAQDAATARNDFRSWLAACVNQANNYTGAGSLLNNSYEIAKRVDPTQL